MAYLQKCLVCALVWQRAAAEEHKVEEKDWEVGATLLGSVVFMMCLHHVTNSSVPNMRRYAYKIINATIGIFCAVLTFQAVSATLGMNNPVFADHPHLVAGIFELVVRGCVVTVFYFWLQLALAYSSNMFMSKKKYEEYKSSRVGAWRTNMSLMTLCVFCAHVTAFATISMWGSVQLEVWFSQNPLNSLFAVVFAALWLGCLAYSWRLIRDYLVYSVDRVEPRGKMWIKATIESENDVIAMALSFLLVKALRFAIVGKIPNAEGQESWHEMASHDTSQVLLLIGCGIMSAVATWILLVLGRRCKMLEERESENEDDAHNGSLESESGRSIQNYLLSFRPSASRILEVVIMLFSMMFAWCSFFASKWAIVGSGLFKHSTCGLTICHAI